MGRPSLPRPCIEPGCRALAEPGRPRCPGHQAGRTQAEATARNQRRRSAPGDGAAARLRRATNRAGGGTCGACSGWHHAGRLRVDHRVALGDGGPDTDGNVWLLCTTCHDDKSATENAARAARRRDDQR